MTVTERFFTLLIGFGVPVIGLLITGVKSAYNTGKIVSSSEQLADTVKTMVGKFDLHVTDSTLVHRRQAEDIAALKAKFRRPR